MSVNIFRNRAQFYHFRRTVLSSSGYFFSFASLGEGIVCPWLGDLDLLTPIKNVLTNEICLAVIKNILIYLTGGFRSILNAN